MDKENFNTPPRAQLTDRGLSIPPTPFLECLGYGTGVNVWQLNTLKSPWAVKNVRNAMQKSKQKQFQKLIDKEAAILQTINHENIIGFRGLLTSLDGRHCLAMESGGKSLGELIEAREEINKTPFSPKQILKTVNAVAKALNYLHTEMSLLHGDIKSYNILIRGDFEEIKLCDLGVCVELNSKGYSKGNIYTGTHVYNAPEVINRTNDIPITGRAEIFSVGLVTWEMLALSPPHCNVDDEDTESDSILDSLDDSVVILEDSVWSTTGSVPGTRPDLPDGLDHLYDDVVEVFNICTQHIPNARPSAAILADICADLLEDC